MLVAKIDRLSRNRHFLTGLRDAGVPFVAADNPQANDLTVHILAAVAEAEAKAISARTKAALAARKARGGIMGGYRGGPVPAAAVGTAGKRAKADAFASRVAPTVKALHDQGFSLNRIAAELAVQGIVTAQGGAWTATAVRRVLARV